MTQIIGVITEEFVVLVSDRLLTYAEGPRAGEEYFDDACKLVSLCSVCGIGYSGLSALEGQPTHEWIAKNLANENCYDSNNASRVLISASERAIGKVPPRLRRQTFLLAGWAYFREPPGLRPHFCAVSNALDQSWGTLPSAGDRFSRYIRPLAPGEPFLYCAIGPELSTARARALHRNLSMLVSKGIGSREVYRLLCAEVQFTRQSQTLPNIGEKMLAMCIPRTAAQRWVDGERFSPMLATLPDEHSVTFAYFDPTYDQLEQQGPTVVCGETALTDVRTVNDPSRDYQSSEVRILALPRRRGR